MSNTRKPRDPHAEREAQKYANPIPSRELILEQLEVIGEPVSHHQLCAILRLEDDEQEEALRRRLKAMSRDGQIICNRRGDYGLAAHMDLIAGRVQGNKDGFGFVIPDDGSDDLFLSPREMARVFDGDRVLASLSGYDHRGRREGAVVEILERRYTELVGRYYEEQGVGLVVPDSKRISHEIIIPPGQSRQAADGQYVLAELVEYPSKRRKAIGKVIEILGDVSTPGLEIDVAVRSFDIPHEWPVAVKRSVARFPDAVTENELAGRHDLRDLPFVTIDGEDAKDFDDAVHARRHADGHWTLYVAIADVSHYVHPGAPLDEEAQERATSVYFPGHVIPMLPEKLSNGLCSLKPSVDRLTMVCEMEISAAGEMSDYCFYEGVIHSHGRLTYNEVADMVQPDPGAAREKSCTRLRQRYAALVEHLDELYALYEALRDFREEQGALDFESTETRIVFGEDRKIREIVPVQRNDAHRLIEECMLSANVAAALLLEQHRLPSLYRIHEGPNPDKLETLREFLGGLGLHLGGGDDPTPMHYQQVLASMAELPNRHLLQVQLIRSMMQAVYQPENIGHFGLGFAAYTHFTSPIRRYPDLLVHRGIRYLLRNKSGAHLRPHADARKLKKAAVYPYDAADMDALGEQCSTAERRADAASYSVVDWLKCEYMQDRVGDEFLGSVTGVTSFGLFVELNDIYIDGLVHVTELHNDYYHFDPVQHCLQGERSGVSYRLGDTVEVKVVRVDLDDKKIDLQMLGKRNLGEREGSAPKTGGKSSARKPARGKSGRSGRAGAEKTATTATKSSANKARKKPGSKNTQGSKKSGKSTTRKSASGGQSKSTGSKTGRSTGKRKTGGASSGRKTTPRRRSR